MILPAMQLRQLCSVIFVSGTGPKGFAHEHRSITMRFTNTKLSGLSAIAGAMLFGASAFAQTTPAPSPNASSQPTTAQPGSEMQPYGANQPATNDPSSQQQMGSPQNSSATMSANAGQPLTQV